MSNNSQEASHHGTEYNFSSDVVLIVPCFNEEFRWNHDYWMQICAIQDLKICFVNDGSSDQTSFKISRVLTNSKCVSLELPKNVGKAEAIRQGINHVLVERPLGIGFLDADGAFPVNDVKTQVAQFRKFAESMSNPPAVWSSRVQLAGRAIDRDILRHYFSRILVTLLAMRLKFTIYDTQSGMKIFPFSNTLEECMKTPFKTHWFVDLEIFLRYRIESGVEMSIWEEPLMGWKDVGGSKLSGSQYWTVLRDIARLNSYLDKKNHY